MRKYNDISIEPPKLDVLLPGGNNCCVVIALSLLLEMPFDDVYENFMFEGYTQRRIMNHDLEIMGTITKLSGKRCTWIRPGSRKHGGFKTIGDYIRHKKLDGGYIITTPRHWFYVKGLVAYDGVRMETGVLRRFHQTRIDEVLNTSVFGAIILKEED